MISWRDKSALIVDDNPVDRLVLQNYLLKMGFKEIHEAENGSMASFKILNAISLSKPFDIVFLDYHMPRVDGLSVLKEIRGNRIANRGKVVMVTGSSEKATVEDMLRAGADEYIVKPLDEAILEQKLRRLYE